MICHDQPFLTIIIHFQPSWTLFKHYQPSLINRFNHLLTMILDDGWFSWWWMMVDFHDGWWSTIMTSWIYLLSTPLYIYIIYIYQLSLIKLVFLLVTMIYQPLYISTIIYIYQLYITSFFCCYFDISPRKRWFWGSGSRTVAVSCMSLLATTGSLGKIRYKPRILEEY